MTTKKAPEELRENKLLNRACREVADGGTRVCTRRKIGKISFTSKYLPKNKKQPENCSLSSVASLRYPQNVPVLPI